MALGIAGATMQGLFRNPMADPGIIGVSAGGAAGAVLSIALGLSRLFFLALPLFAFLGAMGAAFLVYGIAIAGGRVSMATLLLAGVAVSAFLGAVISAVLVLVPSNEALREILFWLAGGLDSRSWDHVHLSAPLILAGSALIVILARDINLLMLGDDDAKSMGVRVGVIRPILIAAASLVTGVAVAVSGTIAFVGLVVPHMLRLVFGPDHRVLIPVSALGGASFLVIADTLARVVVQPAEFRVGIITAFVGAPILHLSAGPQQTPRGSPLKPPLRNQIGRHILSQDASLRKFTRRRFIAGLGTAVILPVLSACQPQIIETERVQVVEKDVPVDRIVTQIVREEVERVVTVEIEKPVQVEKVVTVQVEKRVVVERPVETVITQVVIRELVILEGIPGIVDPTNTGWPRDVEGLNGRVTIQAKPGRIHTVSLGHDEVTYALVPADRVVAVGKYTQSP